MVRWRIALVVLLAFLGLQAHGLAQTTDESARQASTLSLSPSEGRSGSTVTARGKGYCGSVTLRWDDEISVLDSGDSDADGNISITFTVPEGEPGRHTVTSNSDCGGTRASFKVVSSPPTTTKSPPATTAPPPATTAPPPPATTHRPEAPATTAPPSTTAAPQPTPDGTTLRQLEDIAKHELESGVILYNPPGQTRVGVVNRVEVRIAREESDDLDKNLQGKADPLVEQLRVGTTMRAKLEGSAFDIILIGSDVQQLPAKGFREWRWDVIPTASGNHPLFFTVSVLHEKYSGPIDEKVFERRIDVAVNPGYSLSRWFSNNWEKLVAALVGIIAIIEGYRRLRIRRAGDRSAA